MSDHHHDEEAIDPRILHAAAEGCEQSKLLINRRALMGITASLVTWAYMPRLAQAATGQDPRLLIVILRGGMDGLNVAVPISDPMYSSQRGVLALDPAKLTTLNNSKFRLNPALSNFAQMYNDGHGAIIQAIAPPLRIRSHFECQYNLETGKNDSQVRAGEVGWLNKLLSALPAGDPVQTKGLLAVGPAPLIMAGPAEVLAWSPGPAARSDVFNSLLLDLYNKEDPTLAELLSIGIKTDDLASPNFAQNNGNLSTLQKAFRGAGYLLGAEDGPRIAALSIEGWDTHFSQGPTLTARLRDLDDSLMQFKTGLGDDAWSNTVVACVTEFGRTVRPNGTGGSDHGTGTIALLAGGAVAGGQDFGEWPGLTKLLDDRDLQAPNDLRQLFKGILRDHLGVPKSILETTVFPDSSAAPAMSNLIR